MPEAFVANGLEERTARSYRLAGMRRRDARGVWAPFETEIRSGDGLGGPDGVPAVDDGREGRAGTQSKGPLLRES